MGDREALALMVGAESDRILELVFIDDDLARELAKRMRRRIAREILFGDIYYATWPIEKG